MLQPDGFTIGLFLLGVVFLFAPLMVMVGVVATASAVACWATMVVIKVIQHRRG